jgi:hypothetical protein
MCFFWHCITLLFRSTDRGTLITGEEFDSSYKRGKPATFAPNQVIKGWTEAMQLMDVGDKWVRAPFQHCNFFNTKQTFHFGQRVVLVRCN